MVPGRMEDDQQQPPRQDSSSGDAWAIVSYLLAGLVVWGGAGWLLDWWLGTTFLVLVGLLLGAAGALYLVWVRYGR